MSLPSHFNSIDFAAELNPQQLEAVTAPFGPALVLAGAGSGKTRTLTYRVAYLLSKGVAPWRILLLTFTNKAAKEMLLRVQSLTNVEAHKFWGGTFHHIAQKLLRTYADRLKISPSFTIMDESEAESLFNEAVKMTDSGWMRDKGNPKVAVMTGMMSYARNTLRPLRSVIAHRYPELEEKTGQIEKFVERYTLLKRSRGLCDYDDLLELWLQLITEYADVRAELGAKFEHLLVDEYQDTNALQSAIIDAMAPHHNIMAVGDDAQCIYTWRGADVENIRGFAMRHPGTHIYKIELNYRSTPPILQLANSVFENSGNHQFDKELRPTRQGSVKPVIVPVADARAQAQFIVGRIAQLRSEGRTLNDMAILYRAHYHAMELQLELSRLKIPFAITSGMRFFEQAHVKDLVAQLRFAHNPKDSPAFNRIACLLPKVGEVTAQKMHADILRLVNGGMTLAVAMRQEMVVDRLNMAAREDWLALADTIEEIVQALYEQESPAQITARAVEGWYSGFIRTIFINWDSRLDDLASLGSFASRFENFAEYLSQLVLLNSETTDRSVEAPEDSIKLSTVHQAKGLEFPVVFVIGLSEGMFPGRRAVEEGTLEEEKRLFYVAVTRAQDELYMSYPLMSASNGFVPLVPSRFLERLPTDSYELVKTGAGGTLGRGWGSGGTRSGTGGSVLKRGFSSAKGSSAMDLPSQRIKTDKKTEENAKKLFNW